MSTSADARLAILNKANSESDSETPVLERPAAKKGLLQQRQEDVGKSNSKPSVPVPTRKMKVPTSKVTPWGGHNRNFGKLNAENCSDLVDGIRTHEQQIPAIVRAAKDTSGSGEAFELICGARRLWTCSYLNIDLIVEIRTLSDKEAFFLQDLENRDRKDISDYERSVDYSTALKSYFTGDQKAMAGDLNMSETGLSRLLYLVDLPKPIIDAYSDVNDIKVHHGTVYKKMLSDPDKKQALMKNARNLKGQGKEGKDVHAALKKLPAAVKDEPKIFGTATLKKQTKSAVSIDIAVDEKITVEQMDVYLSDVSSLLSSLVD